jgi:hypothetical protein
MTYLPQMADESSRCYLFVAIDRATRRVFIRIHKFKTAAKARRFLRDRESACPMHIRTLAGDEGLTQTGARVVRERAAPPSGM